MRIYAVSEVTRYLKDLIDVDETLQDLWVTGEISNLSRAPSGHLYFTIKDSESQLSCVMWRGQVAHLTIMPQNGEHIIAHGYITIYEMRGVYQFYVDTLQAEGIGLLAARFEELKTRLSAEGLFDVAHKRPLPRLPQRIGLVTSPTGAVLHDIINILRRRYPLGHVILAPTAVQGIEAPPQIIAALAALEKYGHVDVIIVARGGGSLEDLWPFNDEGVARAIYACSVPVITGIGHEVDFTIADFVADVRAPTPSAAAELVAMDKGELHATIMQTQQRLRELIKGLLDEARNRIAAEERALRRLSPRALLDQQRQRVDEIWQRMRILIGHDLMLWRERVSGLEVHLRALSPLAVLDRGFAIVWKAGSAEIVSRVEQVQAGERVQVQVSNGRFRAIIEGDKRRRRSPGASKSQLSLDLI